MTTCNIDKTLYAKQGKITNKKMDMNVS